MWLLRYIWIAIGCVRNAIKASEGMNEWMEPSNRAFDVLLMSAMPENKRLLLQIRLDMPRAGNIRKRGTTTDHGLLHVTTTSNYHRGL